MRRPSFYASLLGLFLAVASHAAERPKVGLVLGGGGARGAAHIGVLEVLEQMRIPVDCVAGTSMGALVAGAWGAGLDAASMRRALGNADWKDMFQDNPGYSEFSYRNKIMLQRFLPGSETGVNAQGAFTPPGVVLGQKIKLFFNQLVHADAGERLIETLPLPVSMIATDIATGERVVYRDGSLTLAMRASMSVPGLMAPLEYRGRKLVDGSLVDNVPIREVRERCGAEVIIAVNVGSPLMSAQEISGLLSVSAQMVAILTEQNVTQSLATLTPADVYIKPDLTGVGAADFERNGEAANRGHAAAIAVSRQLQKLSVDAASYAAWRARWAPSVQQAPRVDEIDIAGLLRVNPAAVTRHVQQQVGRALDTATLNRDLMRVYGEGDFERVDYSLLRQNDRNVLRITPIEKSWGPDYLRLGMNLSSSWNSDAVFSLRAAYQRTWMNALGGELLLAGELGHSSGLSAEWHQPLDLDQRYFADAQVQSRRESTQLYVDNARISEYRQQYRRIELAVGTNWGLAGQVRLGWREDERVLRLDTGLALLPTDSLRTSGPVLTLDLDQLDQIYLPSKGWSVRASWFESARADYSRVSVGLNRVYPLADWVIGLRATHTGATYGELPVQDMAKLGGFLNLSGFAQGQLSGDQVSYAHVRGERILGRMPLGLRGDIRLGIALEAGKVGVPVSEPGRSGWLNSALLYAGGETPLGPVYVGVGRSSTGSTNAYVFIGTP